MATFATRIEARLGTVLSPEEIFDIARAREEALARLLMLLAALLLSAGCGLRVISEILAYQGYAAWAWHCLPVSAVIELAAVSLFAGNMVLTFLRPPAPQLLASRAAAR